MYCYDGSHYEGLIPETIEDEQKCSRLVELWEREEYKTHVQDIPVLWNQLSKEVSDIFMKHLCRLNQIILTGFFKEKKRRIEQQLRSAQSGQQVRYDTVIFIIL